MARIPTKVIFPVFFVVSLTFLLFVLANTTTTQKVETSKAAEIVTPTPEFIEVSKLFEQKEQEQVVVTSQNIPSDIKKDEACIVEGVVVKEGTVASNNICVNVEPTP